MDSLTYAAEATREATHWWFVGRRILFSQVIRDMGVRPEAMILDVGTSTGSNLRMLRDCGFVAVHGVDQSQEAIRFCREKHLGEVRMGNVCALPFPDATFDLVLATDIIEHVDDDRLALREIRRILKPGGCVLVTVPTFAVLWGLQDDVSHHKRRYRMPELLHKLREAGLEVRESFYFNYVLFVPILLARLAMRLARVKLTSEAELNPGWINALLAPVFKLDVLSARWLRPLFGVSALAVAAPAPS